MNVFRTLKCFKYTTINIVSNSFRGPPQLVHWDRKFEMFSRKGLLDVDGSIFQSLFYRNGIRGRRLGWTGSGSVQMDGFRIDQRHEINFLASEYFIQYSPHGEKMSN
jgi:hypothetical protein